LEENIVSDARAVPLVSSEVETRRAKRKTVLDFARTERGMTGNFNSATDAARPALGDTETFDATRLELREQSHG